MIEGRMTAAEMSATRHLIGLSQQELADQLKVSRNTVKDWERGSFRPSPGVASELAALRKEHDYELDGFLTALREDGSVQLPTTTIFPRGWYVAIGARILTHEPGATVVWN